MGEKAVLPLRLPHQGDAGGRADREQAAAYAGRQAHQQPLRGIHLRVHRDDGEHDGDVVYDR